ncbi:hypothetical protein [Actinoplanes sp. NPDC049599]|uniref:hypothetical protein n=1 Tax=Actinoplanes sp. NPDC049599 TaxID=3363903 RepID=UPI0037AFD314
MATDLQWHVTVEITPTNASVFRCGNATAAPLPNAIWVSGVLSLRQGAGLHFISRKDRRLGKQIMVLRVSPQLSASNGVVELSKRFFYCEISFWRHGTPVRGRMSNAAAREMFAAIRDRR